MHHTGRRARQALTLCEVLPSRFVITFARLPRARILGSVLVTVKPGTQ